MESCLSLAKDMEIPELFKVMKALVAEAEKKVKELEAKFKRLDGKALTEKQRQDLVKKELDAIKKNDEDFDPRKHKLKHGIRNYD